MIPVIYCGVFYQYQVPYHTRHPGPGTLLPTLQAVTDFAGEFFKLEELPAPHTEVVQN